MIKIIWWRFLWIIINNKIFLFSISTDLVDGYVARKLQSTSKLGAYFDLTVDFLFISGMFLTFINKELYPPWILITMLFVFSQFILTNLYAKRTVYDPIGKYYGSFLFGGIGLTLLFPDPLVYQVVTIGIVVVSVGSLLSRLIFFLKGSYWDMYALLSLKKILSGSW